MHRILIAAILALGLVCNPNAQTSTWRPVVMADRGMVASGHPLASAAGMRLLEAGGNAVDAAIATWAVQGLVEPMMTGIGGDMFILIYLAKTGEVKFINGTGPAPMAASIDFYTAKGGIPADGPLSVSVPGAVGAAEIAVRQYGVKPLADVLAPAVDIAENGFPVTEHLANALRSSREKLAPFSSTAKVWFRDGQPLAMGDRAVQKEIAATFRQIGREGSEAFYRGALAKDLAKYLRAQGGILAETDLASYRAHEDTPIQINYKGIDVYECPPNSQGHVMLQALNILEGFNLRDKGHNSAPYLHLVTEALKLSFADRNRYVGDPKVVSPIPMKALLSKDYAAARRALIDPSRAIEGAAPAGVPTQPGISPGSRYASPRAAPDRLSPTTGEPGGHTTYLAVVDRDRNMVSITSSLLALFGSGMVTEPGGFFLNNRMAYFHLERDDVNALAPGKRTRHTINPALALKDGKPFLVFGTPGADTQPQTQLQFFLNVVEFGLNVQQALEAPAVISTSFPGSYYPHEIGGKLQVPAALPAEVRDGLAALGHVLDVREARGVGAVKGILIHPKTNVLMGGVSPNGDSYVIGR